MRVRLRRRLRDRAGDRVWAKVRVRVRAAVRVRDAAAVRPNARVAASESPPRAAKGVSSFSASAPATSATGRSST